jgi:YHS domain-containing protein
MSKRYPGNFITGNPVALSQSSNNGMWDVKDVSTAVGAGTWQEPDGIYEISKSLRCRYSSTGSLIKNSNLLTPTNASKWTVSMWVKRGEVGTMANHYNSLFGKTVSASANFAMYFGYSGSNQYDNITWTFDNTYSLQTSQVFRDISGWYHLVFVWDSANSVAAERAKIFVNGVQITQFSVDGRAQISTSKNCWNTTNTGYTGAIGATSANSTTPNSALDGYLAEFINVDGQCLDASYFGYFDPITNIWQPKKYTGMYGNVGGYYPFTDTTNVYSLGRNFVSNYISDSNNIAASSWAKVNSVTATANAAVAPDGTTTASAFVENSTSTNNWVNQATNFATIVGNVYTTSVFVKPAGRSWVMLQNDNFSNGGSGRPNAWFNLSGAGSIGSTNNANASILPVGNGWYRCTMTTTVTSTAAETFYIGIYPAPSNSNLVNPGNGTTALYLWGIAANAGSTLNTLGNVPFNATAPINPTGGGDWNIYGLSLTAGATYDSMVDSPTNVFTSATDVGGTVSGNYCTLNPLSNPNSPLYSVTNASLSYSCSASSGNAGRMTIASTMTLPAGKFYWEVVPSDVNGVYGICYYKDQPMSVNSASPAGTSIVGITRESTSLSDAGSTSYSGTTPSYTSNDVLGFAYDGTANTLAFYKNNTLFGTFSNIPSGQPWSPSMNVWTGGAATAFTINFGQRPFTYTPPAGFKSLNTTNIQALGTTTVSKAAIQPHKWFDAIVWTGNGAPSRTISGLQFKPDLLWSKERGIAQQHVIVDPVRGIGVVQDSASANADYTGTTYGNLQSFNDDGFTATKGSDATYSFFNKPNGSYVGWNWKQSPTSGLNIVSYVGTGANQTITHNLGVAPAMLIVKSKGARSWNVWHKALAATDFWYLEQMSGGTDATKWNSTAPTSSAFSVGSAAGTNAAGETFIAYLWAPVPGFSKFGSYVGNGSTDGPYINCGFRPKYLLFKRIDSTNGHWGIIDTARDELNTTNTSLYANLTNAEGAGDADRSFDFLSNGFKVKTTSGSYESNASGATYLFAAFAESTFALNNRAK